MTIGFWLAKATGRLVELGIGSARLDAELILAHTLRQPRTHLHAHGDTQILARHKEIADSRLLLRLDRVPLAYILGHKEFYGRNFAVTPATLIPRPESEDIISLLKNIVPQSVSLLPNSKKLVDVGTGTGCLGITAKLEFPELDVTLVDVSVHALKIAEKNAGQLEAEVALLRSDLLQNYPFEPSIIIANLPYVDVTWDVSPEITHEPEVALFASDNGLSLIKRLLAEASTKLAKQGVLLLEADVRQHSKIIQYAKKEHFRHIETRGLIVRFER